MSRLWSTSNDLCNADSYLVESLADFIFVFSLFRSSHPMVFLEKGVLEICGKFTGEHPCWSVISIKLLCNLAASACSLACESFLWLMGGLYLVGQSDLFWIQCTSLFHNHWNEGAFRQWNAVPLILLQYYKAVCYNLTLGHMGFLCSPKIHVLGVGSCCKFLSSFEPVYDGVMTHVIQDLNK